MANANADHPLITEDTDVLGRGRSQVQLHGERARDDGARASEAAVVLGHGLTPQADFQVEMPLSGGDASVALKWRFFERQSVSLVLKPDIDERGRWGAHFVAGFALGRVELLGHVGYLRNRDSPGERRSLWHASLAALYEVTENLKLALDMARDTNPDPGSHASIRELVVGMLYALSADADLGLGLKKGLSDAADDRALLAGLKYRW